MSDFKRMSFYCNNSGELYELLTVLKEMGYYVYNSYPTFRNSVNAYPSRYIEVDDVDMDIPHYYSDGKKIIYQNVYSFLKNYRKGKDNKPDFSKGAKFKVNNSIESKLIQEELLAAGYLWDVTRLRNTVKETPNSPHYILAYPNNKSITWSPNFELFDSDPRPEFKINLSATFTKVETPKVVETVELEGKLYNKAEVMERLQSLKEVKPV